VGLDHCSTGDSYSTADTDLLSSRSTINSTSKGSKSGQGKSAQAASCLDWKSRIKKAIPVATAASDPAYSYSYFSYERAFGLAHLFDS
jgi:hypothetical protein